MRYDVVNAVWQEHGACQPTTRIEAEKATRKLVAHFGSRELGSPNMHMDFLTPRVRACWITRKPATIYKGLPRLVHDLSHQIHRARHPFAKPHEHGHHTLELEMAVYATSRHWHLGVLRPPAKPKPTLDERRAKDLERVRARLVRWNSKRKRAETAIRKLKAKERRLAGLIV